MKRFEERSVFVSFIRSYIILLVIVLFGWIIIAGLLNNHISNQTYRINEI